MRSLESEAEHVNQNKITPRRTYRTVRTFFRDWGGRQTYTKDAYLFVSWCSSMRPPKVMLWHSSMFRETSFSSLTTCWSPSSVMLDP